MKILLFGISKDIVGASSLLINDGKKTPTTVKELKQFISNKYPEFNTLSSLAIAVNSNYADDTTLLQEEDEIAIIPPVSGG
ncbi:molybdopterin synthase sulfur carrier subunit [Gillisia sp. Hel_I_86]|uniref:MoaD/ThiS family protein n=1 Tax=Gillisia sp. Hel_I_86 TaxID=1249981 RepID=UPI0011993EC1|nr:MoaD/ThiS family protein [Gillisia sp. Hel_I_86]TVZ27136.1 molybdopterin synthase sulfur carrier subunit [Gillisia sp. Hel_I_86]